MWVEGGVWFGVGVCVERSVWVGKERTVRLFEASLGLYVGVAVCLLTWQMLGSQHRNSTPALSQGLCPGAGDSCMHTA